MEIIYQIIIWIFMAIATEAITEILAESSLFFEIRDKLSINRWLATLVNCGYCLSVWIASLVYLLYCCDLLWLIFPFVVHRMSNIVHIMIKYFENRNLANEVDYAEKT